MACKSIRTFKSLPSLPTRRDLGSHARRAVSNRHNGPSNLPVEDAGTERRGKKRKASQECSQQAAKKRKIGSSLSTQVELVVDVEEEEGSETLSFLSSNAWDHSGYSSSGRLSSCFETRLRTRSKDGSDNNSAVSSSQNTGKTCSKGQLSLSLSQILLRQLVSAMLEIHSKGVLHRDIKAENLLVETGSLTPRLRVIDFGCGCILQEGCYTELYAISEYTPPEWYKSRSYRAGPITVWQLGVFLYTMLDGYFPFSSRREVLRSEPVLEKELSQHCQDLLRSCLMKDPESRPTLESLLLHPWLK